MILSMFSLLNTWYGWVTLIAFISAILVALSFHEAGHAYVAYKQGDKTAQAFKRLTLKPFNHVDPMGFICLLIFGFGWAKPVPVDERNFKNGKKSAFLVSIAGILINFGLAVVASLLYCALYAIFPVFMVSNIYGIAVSQFLVLSTIINFNLGFFNLIPIYPLDGFRLVESVAGSENGFSNFMRRYGWFVLIILIATPLLDLYINFTAGNLTAIVVNFWSKLFGII